MTIHVDLNSQPEPEWVRHHNEDVFRHLRTGVIVSGAELIRVSNRHQYMVDKVAAYDKEHAHDKRS